jgi:DNA polymerase-3 subunit epsilon
MLTGTIVLAYNAKFDRQMFHRAADNWGLPKVDWKTLSPWYCVMLAYAEFHGEINEYYGSFRWQKLASAIAQCGLEADKFHGALADCLATLDIVRYMQEHLPPGQQAHDAY